MSVAAKLVDNEQDRKRVLQDATRTRNRLITATAFSSQRALESLDQVELLGFVNSLSELSNEMTRLRKERDDLAS